MEPRSNEVVVVGGGLAGAECAFQLARAGVRVALREMKPLARSPAHRGDGLAELVCSNSLRSDSSHSAVGLLHSELRRLKSIVLECADATRVPAGEALAVDRGAFSGAVTAALEACPGLTRVAGEVERVPDEGLVVVATGPLTSDALARDLTARVGERLYFYDAIAPIVSADSVDEAVAYRQSRWGHGGDDYLNLPLDEAQYRAFVEALRTGQKVPPRAFEEPRYFEGCLPLEVMADRGDEVLAHGPLKPVGLRDPRTGKTAHAVVQLRAEDVAGTAYNLVGCQTRLTWPEQQRIFRTLPGLANAEFMRFGQVHRNTFLDGPRLLSADQSLKSEPRLFFAGQVTGVEGYVESAASGLLCARAVTARLAGRPYAPPPATTALGALVRHVTGAAHPPGYAYQPSNVIFGLFPPLEGRVKKADKRARYAERAEADLLRYLADPGAAAPCA